MTAARWCANRDCLAPLIYPADRRLGLCTACRAADDATDRSLR